MQVALVLYPHFTMLDIVGPFQVLGDMSECEIRWVASSAGHVLDHTGRAGLVASASLAEVTDPDVVIVPGGFGDTELDRDVVEWMFGPERAQLIQLAIEYDPQPPFDARSPSKAPQDIVDFARPILADTLSDDAVAALVADVRGSG